MDTSISIRLFEWRGDVHCTVDRVGRADHRRYAPRTRVAEFSTRMPEGTPEQTIAAWAILSLADRIGLICTLRPEAGSASPEGDHRGEQSTGVSTDRYGPDVPMIQAAPPPL
jgi:hypothetical protein